MLSASRRKLLEDIDDPFFFSKEQQDEVPGGKPLVPGSRDGGEHCQRTEHTTVRSVSPQKDAKSDNENRLQRIDSLNANERPIRSAGLTFEQLLEQQLRKSEAEALESNPRACFASHFPELQGEQLPKSDAIPEPTEQVNQRRPSENPPHTPTSTGIGSVNDPEADEAFMRGIITPARKAAAERWKRKKSEKMRKIEKFRELERRVELAIQAEDEEASRKALEESSERRGQKERSVVPADTSAPMERQPTVAKPIKKNSIGTEQSPPSKQQHCHQNPLLEDSIAEETEDARDWKTISSPLVTANNDFSCVFSEIGKSESFQLDCGPSLRYEPDDLKDFACDDDEDEDVVHDPGSEEDAEDNPIFYTPRSAWVQDKVQDIRDTVKGDAEDTLETPTKTNKNQSKSVVDLSNGREAESEDNSTPPSKLLYNLFPGLRPQATSNPVKQPEECLQMSSSTPTAHKDLRQKLLELENELEKYRKVEEIAKKASRDTNLAAKKLQAEKKAFEQYKNEEEEQLKQKKDEAMREIKRDKQSWEKQRKAAEILPTKRERQEMELLRKQIETLQTSFKEKESRMKLDQDRLKRRVEELTKRNAELQEEVKVLEQERAAYVERNMQTSQTVQRPPVHAKKQPMIVKHTKGPEPVLPTMSRQAEPTTESSLPVRTGVHPVSAVTKRRVTRITAASNAKDQWGIAELDALQESLCFPACIEQRSLPDGKKERVYDNGVRLMWYLNGSIKEMHDNGLAVVHFINGDRKKVIPDGRVEYWYAETGTLCTTYKDGLQEYEFTTGQIEKHYPDGTNEILFADKTVKYIFSNGEEKSLFPDGRVQIVDEKGRKTVDYPSGAREIQSEDGVRVKYYPDGSVKTTSPDGTQEIRYSDGRIKVKDVHGRTLHDNRGML